MSGKAFFYQQGKSTIENRVIQSVCNKRPMSKLGIVLCLNKNGSRLLHAITD